MHFNLKFKKKHILTTMYFFLVPIYSIPLVIKDVLNNKKYAFILFALLFALLSYIMVPYDTMDLARHYERFEKLKDISIFDYKIIDSYFSLEYIIKIIQIIGLPKEFLPFSYIFLIYFLTFAILHNIFINEDVKTNKLLLIYFLIFFVSQLRLIGYTSGLRTGLANALMLYGIFNLYYMKEKFRGWIFVFLSPIIHNALFLIIPLIFISKIKFLSRLFRYMFYLSIILIFSSFGTDILLIFIKQLTPIIGHKQALLLDVYINGKWGVGYWNEISGNAYIYEKFLKPLPLYLSIIYFIIVKRKSELRNLVYLLFFIVSFFVEFRTLIDRYGDFLIQLILLLMLLEYRVSILTKFKKSFLNLLLVSFLLVDLAGLRVYRDIIFPSWSKILYLPSIGYFFSAPDKEEYIKSQ